MLCRIKQKEDTKIFPKKGTYLLETVSHFSIKRIKNYLMTYTFFCENWWCKCNNSKSRRIEAEAASGLKIRVTRKALGSWPTHWGNYRISLTLFRFYIKSIFGKRFSLKIYHFALVGGRKKIVNIHSQKLISRKIWVTEKS